MTEMPTYEVYEMVLVDGQRVRVVLEAGKAEVLIQSGIQLISTEVSEGEDHLNEMFAWLSQTRVMDPGPAPPSHFLPMELEPRPEPEPEPEPQSETSITFEEMFRISEEPVQSLAATSLEEQGALDFDELFPGYRDPAPAAPSVSSSSSSARSSSTSSAPSSSRKRGRRTPPSSQPSRQHSPAQEHRLIHSVNDDIPAERPAWVPVERWEQVERYRSEPHETYFDPGFLDRAGQMFAGALARHQ